MQILSRLLKELLRIFMVLSISSIILFLILSFSPGSQKSSQGSWLTGYFNWVWDIISNRNLGETAWGHSILGQILKRGVNSLKLMTISMFFSILLTGGFIYLSMVKKVNPFLVSFLRWFLYIISAIPVLVVAYFFFRRGALNMPNSEPGFSYYIIPAFILGVGDGFLSEFIRHAEKESDNLREQGYVRMARARGVKVWKHIRRDFSLRFPQVLLSRMVALISGAVIVEAIFNIPGIGSLALQAANDKNSQQLMGISIFIVLFICFLNFSYRFLIPFFDPRLRKN
jgi:ABC-type dipeptide/oligopeptide/nickel transport system permease component